MLLSMRRAGLTVFSVPSSRKWASPLRPLFLPTSSRVHSTRLSHLFFLRSMSGNALTVYESAGDQLAETAPKKTQIVPRKPQGPALRRWFANKVDTVLLSTSADASQLTALLRLAKTWPELKKTVNSLIPVLDSGTLQSFNKLITAMSDKRVSFQIPAVLKIMEEKKIEKNEFTYSILINDCVRSGTMWRAEKYVKEMIEKGFQPTAVIYSTLLKGYVARKNVHKATEILEKAEELGMKDPFLYTSALRLYTKVGRRDLADALFERIKPFADITHYYCMLHSYFYEKEMPLSEKVIRMREWVMKIKEIKDPLGDYEYETIISSFVKVGAIAEAEDLLRQVIHQKDFKPQAWHFWPVIGYLQKTKDLERAEEWKKIAVQHGVTPTYKAAFGAWRKEKLLAEKRKRRKMQHKKEKETKEGGTEQEGNVSAEPSSG